MATHLSKGELNILVGVLMGHLTIRFHLHKLGKLELAECSRRHTFYDARSSILTVVSTYGWKKEILYGLVMLRSRVSLLYVFTFQPTNQCKYTLINLSCRLGITEKKSLKYRKIKELTTPP